MLASPTIQEIASALARTPSSFPRSNAHSPARVLCLRLQALPVSGFRRSPRTGSIAAVVEAFLKYSPRVQFRMSEKNREEVCWVFIDIASTSHLFAHTQSSNHGEEGLMRSAESLAKDLGFGVQCAIADTPSGAQAFATTHHETIIPPGEERDRLKELSLPLLLHLEGLQPWAKPSAIEGVITFFMMLGFKTIGDLSRFTAASLQERWGETGALLWRRLNAQDRQVISPLNTTEPLKDYVHLDFPVSLVSLLLHQTQKSIDFLFARLQGRRLVAQKVLLILHCEYSKTQIKLEIEPNTPSRDRDLFLTLLENRLSGLDLENPIRDFEVEIVPAPEKSRQMDFFEPRTTDQERAQTLLSLLTQSQLKPGVYRIEPSILPEGGWQLNSSIEACGTSGATALKPKHFVVSEHHSDYQPVDKAALAIASQPHYGAEVMSSPRPTRILKEPMPLSLEELEQLQILSTTPLERLELGWWEAHEVRRDYYFAVSPEGRCLWIFQDLRTEEYFLHGYFD